MTAPERGTATLAPELARRLGMLARTLVAAGRSWALYPPEDPAVRTSIERLMAAVRASGQAFSFGVTPDMLLVDGVPVSGRADPTTEAAAWLHNRDILQLSFHGDVATAARHDLLALLSEGPEHLRNDGGPGPPRPYEHPRRAGELREGGGGSAGNGSAGGRHARTPFRSLPPAGHDSERRAGLRMENLKLIIDTWETDSRGEFLYGVVEAIDPESAEIDPLANL